MTSVRKIMEMGDLATYISYLVAKESGNVLGPQQKSMVISRLKKRMIDLGDLDPEAYSIYLKSNSETELKYLVSILTTHHTFFFREFSHFEFINRNLSDIVARARARGQTKIKVLSAACSRGHEVYSLALFLADALMAYPGMDYEILGTDIDPSSVKFAENGVYNYKEVITIPQRYIGSHWQRGTGEIANFAKIKKAIRTKCKFKTANLLKLSESIPQEKFDIIFCRNVFIYFDQDTIRKASLALKEYLVEDGFFITGLSESLKALQLPDLETHAPSVYSFSSPSKKRNLSIVNDIKPKAKIRVLVVDDSPSVTKLMSKIFSSDSDFELIGTAANGLEAMEFLKTNKVDAMTLDIHMPVMDGVTYLQRNYHSQHPKVVIVSSASREDVRYAQSALDAGASDFVEKPSLDNLKDRADEIKSKLKTAVSLSGPTNSTLDKEFRRSFNISNPESCAWVISASFSDVQRVASMIKDLESKHPPIVWFLEGSSAFFPVIKEQLTKMLKSDVEIFEGQESLSTNCSYIADASTNYETVKQIINHKKTLITIFSECSEKTAAKLASWDKAVILLNEGVSFASALTERASEIFPASSFSHVGTEYLTRG